MNRILVDNHAHQRWINLGIKLQYFQGNYKNGDNIFTTNYHSSKKANNQILILLDSATLIGENYIALKNSINSNTFDEILLVGDICLNEFNCELNIKVRLLFPQPGDSPLYISVLKYNKIKKYWNGLIYFAKDFISHPKEVCKVLLTNKKYIFAGQTGLHSIASLLHNYKFMQSYDDCYDFLTRQFGCEEDVTIESISQKIIEKYNFISKYIEDTQLAHEQPEFKLQRNTVIFKSLFRHFVLIYLDQKKLVYIIKYPNYYIRIYNSFIYSKHFFLDFGGVNGYETLYPRTIDLISNELKFKQFNQNEMKNNQIILDYKKLALYIESELNF